MIEHKYSYVRPDTYRMNEKRTEGMRRRNRSEERERERRQRRRGKERNVWEGMGDRLE